MSSDHKPTYTLKENGAGRAFNPTEVRLYGLLGEFAPFPTLPAGGATFNFETITQTVNVELSPKPNPAGEPQPEKPKSSVIGVPTREKQIIWLLSTALEGQDPMEAGIIFGYAFEGHCYDLPKPKIMLIPAASKDLKPKDHDCGYSDKPGYRVWVVDKLEKCVEIEVNQGFVEQLVLEANLPGRRSPLTYRATQIASSHRGGRLSE